MAGNYREYRACLRRDAGFTRALQELRLRSPVPRDAPGACRCDGQEHCCLPPAVSVIELRV